MRIPSLPTISKPKPLMLRSITICMASFISLIAMGGMSTVVEPGLGWGTVATLLFVAMTVSSWVGLYVIMDDERWKKGEQAYCGR